MGLSITYGAMARIGGSIYAANRPNGGAVFILSFPLAHVVPIRAAREVATKFQPRRVLVTDDDIPNLQALSDLLESKGHTVIRASSGPEALEILLNGDSQIDVVFCDLGMPLVNGWQIAHQAKSLKAPPTFYLVTGCAGMKLTKTHGCKSRTTRAVAGRVGTESCRRRGNAGSEA